MKEVINPNNREELKVGNATFRSVYDNRVTEEDLKQARLELGETEKKKTSLLLELKEKLIKDEDFHYRLDDYYLLRFLRYRKYDLDRTYATIRKFYEFREKHSDLYVIPANFDFVLRRGIMTCLPYRDEEGSIVFWVNTNNWDLNELSLWNLLATAQAFGDVITMNPSMQINGCVGLWDLGGLTARHLTTYANIRTMRILLNALQSIFPWRIKRIALFNCNAVLRGIYYAFRFLISKKIADRIIVMGSDVTELHRYFSPLVLPKEYGGSSEKPEYSIAQYIQDNLPYIEYERSFGTKTKT